MIVSKLQDKHVKISGLDTFWRKKKVSDCVPGLLGWRQIGLKIVFAKMAFVTFAKKNVYFVTYRLHKKLQILNLKKIQKEF